MVFFADDSPVNVSLKFSEVDFPEDCGGINMTICRDALVEQISKLAGIPEERLSPLRLEEGMNIALSVILVILRGSSTLI